MTHKNMQKMVYKVTDPVSHLSGDGSQSCETARPLGAPALRLVGASGGGREARQLHARHHVESGQQLGLSCVSKFMGALSYTPSNDTLYAVGS